MSSIEHSASVPYVTIDQKLIDSADGLPSEITVSEDLAGALLRAYGATDDTAIRETGIALVPQFPIGRHIPRPREEELMQSPHAVIDDKTIYLYLGGPLIHQDNGLAASVALARALSYRADTIRLGTRGLAHENIRASRRARLTFHAGRLLLVAGTAAAAYLGAHSTADNQPRTFVTTGIVGLAGTATAIVQATRLRNRADTYVQSRAWPARRRAEQRAADYQRQLTLGRAELLVDYGEFDCSP